MKNLWIILVVLVILVAGYMGRHQIKSMFMGSATPAPAATTTATTEPAMSPASASSSAVTTTKTGSKGDYLADNKGMTLYIFDKDTTGVSNCNGSCATTWPPFMAGNNTSSLSAGFSVIKRADGSMQYAYKGLPLYYYVKDAKAGDTLGDGVGGVWHLAKP